jgi:hypothetical protein
MVPPFACDCHMHVFGAPGRYEEILEQLADAAADQCIFTRILQTNPAQLYGF